MKVNSRFRSTKRKLTSFFIFFLLEKVQKANGKYLSHFENCLNDDYSIFYDFSLNYSLFSNNSEIRDDKITSLCCNSQKCFPLAPQNHSLCSSSYLDESLMFYCNKINGSAFCNDGRICGGIMDRKSIDNTGVKIGNCSTEIEVVKNYLFSGIGKLRPTWDFVLPDDYSSDDYVYYSSSSNYRYLYWDCEGDKRCSDLARGLICNWDSGGWTCWNSSAFDHNEIYNDVRKNCYLQWKSLLPVSMKFKPNGLPTPWPIALISAGVSLLGVFTASSEIGWLGIFSITLTSVRCLLVLISSWISWGDYRLEGFQYPELAWTASFIIWTYFPAINNLWRKTARIMIRPITLLTTFFREQEGRNCIGNYNDRFNRLLDRLPTSLSWCLAVIHLPFFIFFLCLIFLFILVYILVWFAWYLALSLLLATFTTFALFNIISPPLSYLWNILSLVIYAGLQNFPGTSQFFILCEENPTPAVAWSTIVKCFAIEEDGTFGCFLGSKNALIVNMFIRVLGAILPFFCICGHDGKFYKPPVYGLNFMKNFEREMQRARRESENENEDTIEMDNIGLNSQQQDSLPSEESRRKSFIKYLAKWSSIIIFGVTFFYVVAMALIQVKGLDTTGLESCYINQTLLSSKTGYLKEWWGQEANSLRQITLF